MSHKFVSATHDKKTLTAIYKMADGTLYLRKGGTIPWRLQNPGDVRPNSSQSSEFLQPLRIGIADTAHGKFSIFGCEEDGWETKKKLLRSKLYRDCTIDKMAVKYAPRNDGNDPKKYAEYVLAKSGVSPDLAIKDMDDATLDSVMEAMKTKEGYYNLKSTRVEKWIYTTNISLTDGTSPISDCQLKVTLGGCEYDWKTNDYGELPTIAHMSDGMAIEVKAENSKGELETLYSAKAGNESKNILLKRKFVQYKANTLAQNPKVPREKSQPKPVDYIVQSGDVLSKIATRFGVSVSELVASNGIKDANKIYPGQKLVIFGKNENNVEASQDNQVNLSGQYPPVQLGDTYPLPPYPDSIETKDIPKTAGSEQSKSASSQQSSGQHSEPTVPSAPSHSTGAQGKASTPSSTSSTPVTPSGKPKESKEKLETVGGKNSGNGQAHIPIAQDEAPWMTVAYDEANNRWKWGLVKEANGNINYHSLTGASNSTMEGTDNAWCASFINYCLKISKYPMSGSSNALYFSKSHNFKKINIPIYGAIAVFHKIGTKTSGHANLVYCKTKDGEIGLLGGNQTDSVTINPRYAVYDNPKLRLEFVGYYVPASYYDRAKKIIAQGGDLNPVFDSISELRKSLGANKFSSTDGKTR